MQHRQETLNRKRDQCYAANHHNVTDDPWLTVRQVATELHVAEKTVRRWIASSHLQASIVTKRSGYRIRRSELARVLNERIDR